MAFEDADDRAVDGADKLDAIIFPCCSKHGAGGAESDGTDRESEARNIALKLSL